MALSPRNHCMIPPRILRKTAVSSRREQSSHRFAMSGHTLRVRRSSLVLFCGIVAALGAYLHPGLVDIGATALGLVTVAYAIIRTRVFELLAAMTVLVPITLFPVIPMLGYEASPLYVETVSTALVLAGPVFVFAVRISRKDISPTHREDTVFLWLLCSSLGLAILASFRGYLQGFESWTQASRYSLVLTYFLLGRLAGHDWRQWQSRRSNAGSVVQIAPLKGAAAILAVIGVSLLASGHARFLVAALAGAMAGRLVARRKSEGLIGLVALTPSLAASTWTTTLGALVACGIGVALNSERSPSDRATVFIAVAIGWIAVGVVPIAVGQYVGGSEKGAATAEALPSGLGSSDAADEIGSKLFEDRGPIWGQVVIESRARPNLLGASGAPLTIYGYPNKALGFQKWDSGAHNLLLEGVHQVGLLGGVVLYIAAGLAVLGARPQRRTRYLRTPGRVLGVPEIAAASIGVVIAGSMTGQFVIEQGVGPVLWATLGFVGEASFGIAPQDREKRLPRFERSD